MKNMTKWIQGILISIVAGLVVWFLTRSPHSPLVGPKVALADVDVPERIIAGEEFEVSFRATNQRDKAQPGCEGFVEITPPEENGSGDSTSEDDERTNGNSGSRGSDFRGGLSRIDIADPRDLESTPEVDTPVMGDDTSASDAPERSRPGFVEPRPGIDVSTALQKPRLPQKPVIPEAVTVPDRPSLLTRRHADCRTINPEFTLRGVSGSAVQVTVKCSAHKPGLFQMIYGIHCAKDDDSMWRLDHRGYITVEEP